MGTGYTRNDSANNIADGNVINASDLDGEFDAVQAAFNGSTGHSHDGTTGEGPQIAAGGIASNAVTTAKILDANVTTAKIADANVTVGKMAANSVDSDQYVDGSIDTAHIGNLQVTTAKIAADAIDGTKIADDVIDSEHYVAGSIDAEHLAADIIDGTKIADDSIDSEHYVAGSIDAEHLAANSVTSAKLDTNIQVAGTLGVTGETTLTTHLNMGDGDIIKLGDSADLQIYHDGASGASYIAETGASNLILLGTNFRVNNAGNTQSMIVADDGGKVQLHYAGAGKFETTTSGVDVTGNVVVSGTVDGRDVASDGSKLDGIESGATADQSASEILTLIKTVDGSGSGLDADTLDGVDSASFLRSDAADTKTSGDLNFSDNVKAIFGAGTDLEIFHDGSNSIIRDQGAGSLFIDGSSTITLRSGDAGETYAVFNDNGAVSLRYDNVEKFVTKSDGVDITGELQCDSLDVDGNADISGTLTMSGDLDLQDNDVILIGSSDDLQIYHDGSNSYIQDVGVGQLVITSQGSGIYLQKGTTETMATFSTDAGVNLYYDNSIKFETTSGGVDVTGNMYASGNIGLDSTDYISFSNNAHIAFITNNSEEFRMESDGDFHADGDVIAYSTTISDERLKTDIEKIENATDKVSQLNGYTFTYKADGKKSAGVIAQEVEKVLPSAVSEKELPLKTDDGVAYKTVQYDQIIGLLIESIKELKQEINELKGE
jgi:hypothetical protein